VIGCVNYVGFHVFDRDHLACCNSDVCEDWLEEQFDLLGGGDAGGGEYYPDDDDDDDDDRAHEDDDEFEKEF